jgi:hypothetical protein
MMSEELKPCPWCGELPRLYTMSDNSCNDYWEIGCAGEECAANPSTMSFISVEDAIEKWNTRFEEQPECK